MIGFILSLLTALSESFKDVFSKKSIYHVDEYVVAWALHLFTGLFLAPLLLFHGLPDVENNWLRALVPSSILNVAATVCFMKAIKLSDLSVTVPMITFTPLFMLVTSPLLVNEFPSPLGLVGVIVIVVGSYLLHTRSPEGKSPGPLKALSIAKGARWMLGVSFIWSFTANIDKIGVQASSPVFWSVTLHLAVGILLFPVVLYFSRHHFRQLQGTWKTLVPVGIFMALTMILQMTAIQHYLVAYVIAIKRLSILLSVLWGYLIFKEENIQQRLLGASIMVVGVFLISLS